MTVPNGMPPLPKELLDSAKSLGGVFDPSKLPDQAHMEFTLIDGAWSIETRENDIQNARYTFWFPMLPFIKFSIPFGLPALINWHQNIGAVIERMTTIGQTEVKEDGPPESELSTTIEEL